MIRPHVALFLGLFILLLAPAVQAQIPVETNRTLAALKYGLEQDPGYLFALLFIEHRGLYDAGDVPSPSEAVQPETVLSPNAAGALDDLDSHGIVLTTWRRPDLDDHAATDGPPVNMPSFDLRAGACFFGYTPSRETILQFFHDGPRSPLGQGLCEDDLQAIQGQIGSTFKDVLWFGLRELARDLDEQNQEIRRLDQMLRERAAQREAWRKASLDDCEADGLVVIC